MALFASLYILRWVGQLGKLRPIVNRPECPLLADRRRYPTAAQAARRFVDMIGMGEMPHFS
jgi:hypothetical protein